MKRFFASSLALACLVALPTSRVCAATQESSRLVHFGFGGGLSVPVSDAKDAFKTGFHGKGWVSFSPPRLPFGLRAALGYEKLDFKAPPTTPTATQGTGSVLSGLGDITLGFPVGPIKPYVLAGVGAFNFKADDGTGTSTSKTQFGINGGVGVELRLGQISAFVEGRVENIYTDKGLNSAFGSLKTFQTQIIPVTFGISY
ncbi:MAG: porin family protein [Candidatus Eisenbacteria bacterium]|uniref:Porin family protein n=1 Tax=Eiseniibacteriota bacterium TaxID=2212470 RepID=A0A9D6L733_UNCEI|nr:porin family protein [Candidatus Eisenbacteria bacterium]MBI3539044.1 porin family protein [Candidatus Eisenbacteria bacterium]